MKNLKQKYKDLEKLIGTKFKDLSLLDAAFVHKSYVNESKDKEAHNERLEFLGDAVLELVVTEYLYKNYGNPEGDLTNWRSALVRGANLAEIAKELKLNKYLYLSRGEEKSGGRQKGYILANTVEALIGAIFLDQGYKKCHTFINKFIISYLGEILEKGLHVDPKSKFQEIAQAKFNLTPNYELIEESGPDHDKKFLMAAYIGDKKYGEGSGTSKQQAEQNAATDALEQRGWIK
ncbi:MAG: ribonuclease III [Patescibacteria group bacterium]|nr:ribonuclease III [Patescibacteria group bacterium]